MKLEKLLPLIGVIFLGVSCNGNISLGTVQDIINGTNPAPSVGPTGLAPGEEYWTEPR